jgi:hypothetical protein
LVLAEHNVIGEQLMEIDVDDEADKSNFLFCFLSRLTFHLNYADPPVNYIEISVFRF